jgi:hypothetical protein
MTAARRNKITKDFSMVTVIYDLPLGKVNCDHIEILLTNGGNS